MLHDANQDNFQVVEGQLNVHHSSSACEDYDTCISSGSEISPDECEENDRIPALLRLLSIAGQANISRDLTKQLLACDAVNSHLSYHKLVCVAEVKVILPQQLEPMYRKGHMGATGLNANKSTCEVRD